MERPTADEMKKWDLSAAVIGINWVTGETKIDFIAGSDVEGRAKCSAECYERSWPDWTFTYLLRK